MISKTPHYTPWIWSFIIATHPEVRDSSHIPDLVFFYDDDHNSIIIYFIYSNMKNHTLVKSSFLFSRYLLQAAIFFSLFFAFIFLSLESNKTKNVQRLEGNSMQFYKKKNIIHVVSPQNCWAAFVFVFWWTSFVRFSETGVGLEGIFLNSLFLLQSFPPTMQPCYYYSMGWSVSQTLHP